MAKSKNKAAKAKSSMKETELNKRLTTARKAQKVATKKLESLKKALGQADLRLTKMSARVATLEAKAGENLAV